MDDLRSRSYELSGKRDQQTFVMLKRHAIGCFFPASLPKNTVAITMTLSDSSANFDKDLNRLCD
jgi:hypothetical protein